METIKWGGGSQAIKEEKIKVYIVSRLQIPWG